MRRPEDPRPRRECDSNLDKNEHGESKHGENDPENAQASTHAFDSIRQ
jgi:hypothetical protein